MSDALVPGGGGFQQQGSVDWVDLSRSSYTFALHILVRLSKADLNPATLAISLIICSRFVIKPNAQKRIHDALSSLRSFSSSGKLLWFGFGIKPILKDLAESEHGMACIALCACMSVSYDSFYVATVLRELCAICEAPPDYIPSIHQWKTLVQICAGSISSSKFPNLLEGLLRLVRPGAEISLHQPTSAKALARAIKALADVSNRKLARVTIAGGLDCIWLAAVAEWLLALDVEIRQNSGDTVYWPSGNGSHRFPEVTVIFISDNDQPLQLNRCHVVPKGERLWREPQQHQLIFRGGRSEWTNILVSTFGSRLDDLLYGKTQEIFALFIYHASCWAETYHCYGPVPGGPQRKFAEDSIPFRRFHFGHLPSTSQDFLAFAAHRLPELAGALGLLRRNDVQSYTGTQLEGSIDTIALECMCQWCDTLPAVDDRNTSQFCLKLMAETIVLFLWILSATEVDPSVRPCPNGLQLLYMKHRDQSHLARYIMRKRQRWKYAETPYFPTSKIDILTAVLMVFSGSTDNQPASEGESSAVSRHGVCVFFRVLEDLDLLPEDASIVRVVPGHIDFEGTKYDRICDPGDNISVSNDGFGPDVSFDLVAEETPQPGCISAAYKLSCNLRSYEWILGISGLAIAIAKSIRGPVRCGERCGYSFPQTQEAKMSTPNLTVSGNLSDEPIPLTSGWSLVSATMPVVNETINLRVVQATIRRLYLELSQRGNAYHLTYINICHGCLCSFPRPTKLGGNAAMQSSELHLSEHNGTEGTITITLPSDARSWVDRRSMISEVTLPNLPIPLFRKYGSVHKGALYYAVTLGRQGMLQLLLQGGAKVNTMRGETLLHCAVEEGQNELAKILLVWGAHLELRDKCGQTPLFRTVRGNHYTTATLLLERCALVNTRDNYGQTPLSSAAFLGYLKMVDRLLQEKADVNAAPAEYGRTALQAAAGGGHLAVVKRLNQAANV